MIDYFIGILLTFFSAFLFQMFGICLTNNEKSYAYSFIIGYIIYSFLVAVVGIPIQILNLKWMYFFIYMILLLTSIILFIIYNIRKGKVIISKESVLNYIKHNWFLYVGAIFILGFSLVHMRTIWTNQLTDDAYYLNKMATLPYINQPFITDPVTGFIAKNQSLSYNLNTYELEASFYIFISRMNPALYARAFLAILNYFIMFNSIIAMMEKLLNVKNNIKLQYFIPPVFLMIVMNAVMFTDSDTYWTIVTAGYYGSSLVKIACLFIIITPLIGLKKLNIHAIIITFCSCVVMVSKSSGAVSLLFVLAIAYLITLFLYRENKSKKDYIFGFFLLIVFLSIAILLPNKESMNSIMITKTIGSLKNLFVILSIVLMFLISDKSDNYKYLSKIFLFSILLIILPEANDIYENVTQYDFVSQRTLYSILVGALVIECLTVLYNLFHNKNIKKLFLCSSVMSVGLFYIYSSTNFYNTDVIGSAKAFMRNPYLIPDSTIKLGEALEDYKQQEDIDVNVIMFAGVTVDNYPHFPAAILRTYAPHVNSVIGGIRVASEISGLDCEFNGFSVEEYQAFVDFAAYPSEESIKGLDFLLKKYPFNCLVGVNYSQYQTELLSSIGYEKYQDISDYSLTYNIYIKK